MAPWRCGARESREYMVVVEETNQSEPSIIDLTTWLACDIGRNDRPSIQRASAQERGTNWSNRPND